MSISEVSSSTISSSTSPIMRIQHVPKSVSERLLSKYSDVSELGFDYSQSGIWSPPIQRSVFLSSPNSANNNKNGKIFSHAQMAANLSKLLKRRQRKRRRRRKRHYYCFHVVLQACLCSPKRPVMK